MGEVKLLQHDETRMTIAIVTRMTIAIVTIFSEFGQTRLPLHAMVGSSTLSHSKP